MFRVFKMVGRPGGPDLLNMLIVLSALNIITMINMCKMTKMLKDCFFLGAGGRQVRRVICKPFQMFSRPGGPHINILHIFNSSDFPPQTKNLNISNIKTSEAYLTCLNR